MLRLTYSKNYYHQDKSNTGKTYILVIFYWKINFQKNNVSNLALISLNTSYN